MDYDNFTNWTSEAACSPSSGPSLSYLQCFVLGLFFVFTFIIVTGNLLVIISIVYFRQLHTPTNFLILSLALSDLLVGIVVVPFSVVVFGMPCWFVRTALCRVRGFFDIMLCISSILNLCFISIERYYAVCQPLSYVAKLNARALAAMIATTWTVSTLCGFVLTFGGQKQKVERCAFFQSLKLGVVAAVVAFYFPAVIMLTIYTKIFLVVKRQVRSIHHSNPGAAVSKAERKATWTLVIVLGVYLLCWAPLSVSQTCLVFNQVLIPLPVMESFKGLGWLNSILNPFIYAYSYTWFRSASKKILSGKIFYEVGRNTRLF